MNVGKDCSIRLTPQIGTRPRELREHGLRLKRSKIKDDLEKSMACQHWDKDAGGKSDWTSEDVQFTLHFSLAYV